MSGSEMLRRMARDPDLHKLEAELRESGGRTAPATVLKVERRARLPLSSAGGMKESRDVVWWRVKLRVEPPRAEPFEVEIRRRSRDKRLPGYGDRVQVIYDPNDHRRVAPDRFDTVRQPW